jgi:hypothetical protein
MGMDPRKFLNFFKTKTGKIVLFLALLGVAGTLYYGFAPPGPVTKPKTELPTPAVPDNHEPTSIDRGGSRFALPSFLPLRGPDNGNPAPGSGSAPPALPITLYSADTEERELSENYAPYGRLIPCETVLTIDSARITTPIVGFVTQDVKHEGRLIIPAGAEVHGMAQVDRSRERIASQDNWYIVWRTTDRMNGSALRLHGVALDMERNNRTGTWGLTDGSAGLRGDLIKSDNWAEIKLFVSTFLSAAATGLQQTENVSSPLTGATQQVHLATPQNAALQGTSAVLNRYADQIADSIKNDGFYVRVPAGKQFYLYVTQAIDLQDARQGEVPVDLSDSKSDPSSHPQP